MENINKASSAKYLNAISSHLKGKGYEILATVEDPETSISLVCSDDGDLVFVSSFYGEGQFPEPEPESIRPQVEREAVELILEHDFPLGQARFDIVSLMIAGDHKAILRHHIDALQ